MNVTPGSAFFQTVQGSVAQPGAQAGGRSTAQSSQTSTESSQASDRQRVAATDFHPPRNLRPGPPGTNLDIVV